MKSNQWVIEIDGKKYAIDRTFSNEPAIYRAGGVFMQRGHTDGIEEKPTEALFDPQDGVFILARRI